MDVQPTNLQQLRDAIMSIWTNISEECFQHLVDSMPRRIKEVRQKGVQPGTSKVYLIKWPVSVCVYIYYIYIYIYIYNINQYIGRISEGSYDGDVFHHRNKINL